MELGTGWMIASTGKQAGWPTRGAPGRVGKFGLAGLHERDARGLDHPSNTFAAVSATLSTLPARLAPSMTALLTASGAATSVVVCATAHRGAPPHASSRALRVAGPPAIGSQRRHRRAPLPTVAAGKEVKESGSGNFGDDLLDFM